VAVTDDELPCGGRSGGALEGRGADGCHACWGGCAAFAKRRPARRCTQASGAASSAKHIRAGRHGACFRSLAHRAQLEGGLRLGSGLASGSLRLGALAAIGYRPPSFPLQPWLSAGYAAQVRAPSTVAVSWVTLGAGAAAELAISAAISLRLRSDLLLQRVGVTATDSVQRSTQSGASWKPGWLVGADLLWPAGDSLAWTAGIDAWTTSGQVIVRVEQRTVRTEPIFGVAGRLGARWRWP